MNSVEEQIKQMINRPYTKVSLSDNISEIDIELDKDVCWSFCRQIFSLFDIDLPEFPHKGIKKIEDSQIVIPSIVLFCGASKNPNWHSGVVWPDGLHFIHTNFEPPFEYQKDKQKSQYIVRKERLTCWPWNMLIEGYYIHNV